MKALVLLPVLLARGLCSTVSTCGDLKLPDFEGFQVLSSEAREVRDYEPPVLPGLPSTPPLSFCNVTLMLTHPGANDYVRTTIWLPLDNWNGRFLATGGGGFSVGLDFYLPKPVSLGYATGTTDGGLTLNGTVNPIVSIEWALKPDDTLNDELLTNFAHRSLHEMTVVGKAAVRAFYGRDAGHSYYSGCSQGGRQGYSAAERWPADYDGVMANAPALFAPSFVPADFWPPVVMNNMVAPPMCVLDAYWRAMIQECDGQDGTVDGLVSAPDECRFDPASLVGREVDCAADLGANVTITAAFAEVVQKILEGARTQSGESLWYGLAPGAYFSGTAGTRVAEDGKVVPVPFAAAESWLRHAVARDRGLDTSALRFSEYEVLFRRSRSLWDDSFGSAEPDLAAFRGAGGKMLTWHGLADGLIAHPGTLKYRQKVVDRMEGGIDDFYRVFLAPGAGHCGDATGHGPVPVDPLGALVDWVENGVPPTTLFASATGLDSEVISRNLCLYPWVLRYKGQGDVHDAESFICEGSGSEDAQSTAKVDKNMVTYVYVQDILA